MTSSKENLWIDAKRIIDSLKNNNLISIDEWYNSILFVRNKLNLPICDFVYSLDHK